MSCDMIGGVIVASGNICKHRTTRPCLGYTNPEIDGRRGGNESAECLYIDKAKVSTSAAERKTPCCAALLRCVKKGGTQLYAPTCREWRRCRPGRAQQCLYVNLCVICRRHRRGKRSVRQNISPTFANCRFTGTKSRV